VMIIIRSAGTERDIDPCILVCSFPPALRGHRHFDDDTEYKPCMRCPRHGSGFASTRWSRIILRTGVSKFQENVERTWFLTDIQGISDIGPRGISFC
jgi:hypothetical protein